MDIRNTRQLKDFSAGRLANAREGQKIILYFSLITIAVSAVATVVSYILSQQIAKTGGLGSMGVRSALTTAQMLLPIVQAAGINEIAFGVTVICNIAIGNLTPPVGVCLYVAANSSHAKVEGIIKNIAPFVLMAMVDIGILMVFPQLITLIPDMMH